MTPDQVSAIQNTIKETVNGKIDLLTFKIESHITADNEWKKENATQWGEMKESVKPVIDTYMSIRSFGKVGAYIAGVLTGIMGLLLIVLEIIRSLNKLK